MINFKTKIEGHTKEYVFECYENTEPIEIGDKYIFFFGGIADAQICNSESVKSEINKHNRPYKEGIIDLVHNFWEKCYKIKSTDFDFTNVQ